VKLINNKINDVGYCRLRGGAIGRCGKVFQMAEADMHRLNAQRVLTQTTHNAYIQAPTVVLLEAIEVRS